jgi:hypothetical protein
MNNLLAHAQNPNANYLVNYQAQLDKNRLEIDFMVVNQAKMWNEASHFCSDARKNWGLWQHDVIEVFVQPDRDMPYREFQLSVDDKSFELEVFSPRISFATPLACSQVWKTSKSTSDQWQTHFSIKLLDPSAARIGLFAILGPVNKREYFALNPNLEANPDFHRPDLFFNVSDLCRVN